MKLNQNSNENMEAPFDPENQFILRLPHKQAERLREALKIKNSQIKNRLKIAIELDQQHGVVKFDEWDMDATLYNLPTIIESYKTLDRINLYKTADISHLLVCKEKDFEIKENVSPQDNPLYFQWKHGITPPLKNVKKRRFRKTLKKGTSEAQTISRELKYILKTDMMAIKVEYRLIDAEPTLKPSQTTEEFIFGEALSSSEDEREANQEENIKPRTITREVSPMINSASQDQINFKALAAIEEEPELINIETDSTDHAYLDAVNGVPYMSTTAPHNLLYESHANNDFAPFAQTNNHHHDKPYQGDLGDGLNEEQDNSMESLLNYQ